MGHLGHLKEQYQSLVHRLGAGPVALPEPRDSAAWGGWKEILEILYTPEEAELASKLPIRPSSLKRVAARLGTSPEEIKPRLDAMCDRGLVLDLVHPDTGEAKYLLAPPVVGFFEFSMMRAHDGIPKKRMAEALHAYTHGDPAFAEEVFGSQTVIGRTLVHETALGDEELPDVLDWERASAIIESATTHAVAICYCRHKAEHLGESCDAPKEVCLVLNGGGEFVIRHAFGRKIDKSEAMEIMAKARESGLVQIGDNVLNRPMYICNCCGCCCGQLQGINQYDLQSVTPSGFTPHSDPEICNGCSRCARACPVTAIVMAGRKMGSKRKNTLSPVVDAERCIGCGVCADTCVRGAMKMERDPVRPTVPVNSVERSLRMSLERGRLAHLLFDEGSGRGSRFLNRVILALNALPVVQKALAMEQVKSRFVRAMLARVADPTGGEEPDV
ncbi:MAG: 4Fe-4S dicluster domain-containing protein [Planctomycetes bacterium]|nr:4Fe-4S dicluster domain-containing protein [Planctomycetota bacterium]